MQDMSGRDSQQRAQTGSRTRCSTIAAQGSHVWDVDGNEFIDYVLARGPLLLGHSPKPVLDAVKRQLDAG